VDALRRRNLNLPGGAIKMGRGEFNVRTEAEYLTVEDILQTVLKGDGAGGYVYVRDVATVADTFEDRTSLARFNGEPSVNITVKKDRVSNAIHVVEDVGRVMGEFEARLPAGISMVVVEDSSVEIRDRLA
jgi:HAE1 family hydrophobic/amphiphilic exporter-1